MLVDWQVPEPDSDETTRQIRERESAQPAARRLPFSALMARATAGNREKCEAAGMDHYPTKPMPTQELVDVLSRWPDAQAAEGHPAYRMETGASARLRLASPRP
jgi:CheY-like chemotaxis protein